MEYRLKAFPKRICGPYPIFQPTIKSSPFLAYSKFKACDGDGHGYEGVDDGDNEDAFEFDDQDDHDDNDDGVEYDDHDDQDDQDDHDDAVEFDDQDEGWALQTIWFQQIPTLAHPE